MSQAQTLAHDADQESGATAGVDPTLQEQVRDAFHDMKGAVTEALDNIANAGAADQMRGRFNETMGAAKFAVAQAIESPELAFAGIIQKALGEVQQSVGDAKLDDAADAPADSAPISVTRGDAF
jgi:uncharacterized protein YjbJ (UPF0337 family)